MGKGIANKEAIPFYDVIDRRFKLFSDIVKIEK